MRAGNFRTAAQERREDVWDFAIPVGPALLASYARRDARGFADRLGYGGHGVTKAHDAPTVDDGVGEGHGYPGGGPPPHDVSCG